MVESRLLLVLLKTLLIARPAGSWGFCVPCGPTEVRLSQNYGCGSIFAGPIDVSFQDGGTVPPGTCDIESGINYEPKDPLSVLNNYTGDLNSTLKVDDSLSGDTGMLTNFCVQLDGTVGSQVCLDPPSQLVIPDGTSYFSFRTQGTIIGSVGGA